MNNKLQNKLNRKYYGKMKLIPYTNCCGTCLGNKFDDEDRDKYKLFARLYLEGMNYEYRVNYIYVHWNDIEVNELEKYADPILREYLCALNVSGTITYPEDDSQAIEIKLRHPLWLEDDREDEDW